MVDIDEIIANRKYNNHVPAGLDSLFKRTPGVTTERYANNVIDSLGGQANVPAWLAEVKRTSNPALPTLDLVLPLLGLKDDGEDVKDRKTAVQKFVDGAWKKDEEAKEKVESALGARGWKFIKDELWPTAVHDQMMEDIKKGRYDAVHDGTVSGWLTRMMFPRSTERLANTGDITAKDVLLDVGENVAMSVPGSAYVKYGGKALGKILPSSIIGIGEGLGKGVTALKNSNSALVTALGHGIGAVPNIAGNAVAPLATEVLDDIAYDPGEGMDDRANFSAGDVAVGTAVNQAVNRGLVRAIAPYIDRYSGSLKAGGAKKLRDFFARLGRSQSSLGDDYASGVRNAINDPVVRAFPDGERLTLGEWEGLKQGSNIIPEGMTMDDFFNNITAERVLNLVDDGTLSVRDANSILHNIARRQSKKEKYFEKLEETFRDDARIAAEAGEIDDAIGFTKQAEDVQRLRTMGKTLEGAKVSDIIRGTGNTGDVANANAIQPEEVKELFMQNPELFNYAYWHGQGGAGKLDKLQNAVHQAWPSLIINKAGKSDYAPEVTKVMKEPIEKNREDSKQQAKKISVSRVLDAGKKDKSLTADDQKWLAEVANNPDVLRDGFADLKKNDDFKMWLLTGGNDLLSGTEAHRPIWEIK